MTIRVKQLGVGFTYETGPSGPGGVGGPSGAVQYNDNGFFNGTSNFTFDGSTNSLTVVNLSGSLTKLSTGISYLAAGSNITITSASNGQITISSTGGGGAGGGDSAAQYLVLSATGSLSDERVFTTGTGLSSTDGGAGGNYTLAINNSIVATVSGTTFTGATQHNAGLSGSLTRLTDGTSYLIAGSNVTIASASNGAVTISSTGTGTPAGSDQQIQFNNGGSFGASANLNFDSMSNLFSLTGSFGMKGNITPDEDYTYTLGTAEKRWAHVYTGDLHLRNDRGDWTIVEERDYLCVINNITGKKYKMLLQPLDDDH